MDMMLIRKMVMAQMAMQNKKNLKIETGTFTVSTVNNKSITVNHTLGKVPKLYCCDVDDTGVSQTTTQLLSYYGTLVGTDRVISIRSRNGTKYYGSSTTYAIEDTTPPTTTEITFNSPTGIVNWAASTYSWTAMTWDD